MVLTPQEVQQLQQYGYSPEEIQQINAQLSQHVGGYPSPGAAQPRQAGPIGPAFLATTGTFAVGGAALRAATNTVPDMPDFLDRSLRQHGQRLGARFKGTARAAGIGSLVGAAGFGLRHLATREDR